MSDTPGAETNWLERIADRLDVLTEFARARVDKPFKPRGSLVARSNVFTIPAGGVVDGAIPADPNRRRLILSSDLAGGTVGSKEDVRSGNGYPVPTGGNTVDIKTVAALSLAAAAGTANTFYIWIEGD